MIEYIENLGSELQLQLLAERRRFEQRQIQVRVARTDQRVAAQAAKVLSARYARRRAAVARWVQSARDLERRKVQEIVGRVSACIRIADDVGSRKEFARAVVVVKQVHVKRAPASQREDPVQLPAVAEFRVALQESRNLIAERPHQPMPHVEIRIASLLVRPE